MECPRCGGSVTIYQLGDRESYVCGDCEYVGIDVEHGAEPGQVESWDEAMERFYERFAGADGTRDGRTADGDSSDGVVDGDDAPAGETGAVEAGVDSDEGGNGDEAAEEGAVDAGGTGDNGTDDELTPAIVRVDADAGGS